MPIEVFIDSRPGRESEPGAVLTGQGPGDRVLICNPAALARGVRRGQRVNAALALCPELELLARDEARETRALEALAAWAVRFTPTVSIAGPDALLLDIRASLNCFGGFEALRASMAADLDAMAYRAVSGCAPTAPGAAWLARAGDGVPVFGQAELAGRLSALPVECLGWSERLRKLCRELGVNTLGECVRLPRRGFAQRFGPECLRELDRGFGRAPDALESFRPPKTFHAEQDLPAETGNAHLLIEALRLLLGRLRRCLVVNQCGVRTLWLQLYHRDAPATLMRIGLLRPAMDTAYLLELARIRCDDFRFPAPVVSIALHTDRLEPCETSATDLFGGRADDETAALALTEQLQARLSEPAVHGIRSVPEHRPESAWTPVVPAGPARVRDAAGPVREPRRPLWLLAEPLALKTVADRPVFRDVLRFEDGPERIETGWWDGRDVRRDYYVAHAAGRRLWVFRDCRASRWYLHGLFG